MSKKKDDRKKMFGKHVPAPESKPEPEDIEEDLDLQRKLNLLEQTLAFRAIGLLELGFNLEQVMVLVHTPDIVHSATPLIERGCSVEVAFDLLS